MASYLARSCRRGVNMLKGHVTPRRVLTGFEIKDTERLSNHNVVKVLLQTGEHTGLAS